MVPRDRTSCIHHGDVSVMQHALFRQQTLQALAVTYQPIRFQKILLYSNLALFSNLM